MKNFSEKLKRALRERGITQEELCQHPKINMTSTGFGRTVKNDNLTIVQLENICEILNLEMDYFLEIKLSKPEGAWKRMISELSNELNDVKIKLYQIQESGVNFLKVSRYNASCGRYPFFYASSSTNLLTLQAFSL